MLTRFVLALAIAAVVQLVAAPQGGAQAFNSGSTGADGALAPASGTVTLALPLCARPASTRSSSRS